MLIGEPDTPIRWYHEINGCIRNTGRQRAICEPREAADLTLS